MPQLKDVLPKSLPRFFPGEAAEASQSDPASPSSKSQAKPAAQDPNQAPVSSDMWKKFQKGYNSK